MTTHYALCPSPIGELVLTTDGTALTGVYMPVHKHGPEIGPDWRCDETLPVLRRAAAQLGEYFQGQRTQFDLPLSAGGSEFQHRVWAALLSIPYGGTSSYGELARRIGTPNGSRAVGLANGRNPISIIVPCHRVIGSDGSLTGYGGGLERKRALLEFEAAVAMSGPQRMRGVA